MRTPAQHPHEADRIADLYDYGILDTPAEKIFDEVAQLAASICGTPIGAVTLIDRDRQWFKAQHGLDLAQTTRDQSICGHAILEHGLFEVPDTQADERFADNPLLTGSPGIRFYTGSPLTSDRGNAIGMLCVMDSQPRQLTDAQRQALHQLADLVMAIVEAGRKSRLAHWFGTLLDNVRDEIFIADPDSLRYLHANQVARQQLGYSLDELRRLTPMDITAGAVRADFEGYVRRLREGELQVTFNGERCRTTGDTYPFEARWQLLSTGGRPVVLSIVRDITRQRDLERAKDELIGRLSRELELARTLQRALLPAPARMLSARMEWMLQASSYVGGDTFEYVQLDQRHLCFFMIDVSGHGVPAAMLAHGAQHQLYGLARRAGAMALAQGKSIEETAVSIVSQFNERTMDQKGTEMYFTLLFGILDAEAGQAALVQAGHPPPLHALPGSDVFTPVGEGGLPIGILDNAQFEAIRVAMPPGSRLIVYSDGVTECANARGAAFGEERLQAALARTRGHALDQVVTRLSTELGTWRGASSFEDDVTVLALETA